MDENMSNRLPKGWEVCRLRECVDVLDGQRVPVNSDDRAGRHGAVPYYGATGRVGWIDDYLFNEELLLIGEDGAPFFDKSKSIAYIIAGKSWVNNHAHVLRALAELTSNRYLKCFLDSFDFHGYVNGTTRLKLTQVAMNEIAVPLAPLPEQRRIVAKLETLLDKVEACEKRLAKIPVILKRFRQSILAAACSGRLTADWREKNPNVGAIRRVAQSGRGTASPLQNTGGDLPDIPETWRWIKLPDTGEMNRGKSRHRPRNVPFLFGGSYPFIQTGDIAQSGGRIMAHKQTYSEAGLAQSRLWPAGTICITIAANIAESALLTYPACFPDSVVGIIADNKVCVSEYVEYFIRIAKADLSTFAPATAQKNINIAILNELSVPLPPLPEQQEIVRRVEALFALANHLEARYTKAKAYVDKLTQSILAKAFRGELVPQDPNDEPASVLLERIRARHDKEKENTTKRKRK